MRSDAIKVLIHYSSMQVYKNHVHQTPDVLDECKNLYTQEWTPHFKPFMKMVQKASNTLFTFLLVHITFMMILQW